MLSVSTECSFTTKPRRQNTHFYDPTCECEYIFVTSMNNQFVQHLPRRIAVFANRCSHILASKTCKKSYVKTKHAFDQDNIHYVEGVGLPLSALSTRNARSILGICILSTRFACHTRSSYDLPHKIGPAECAATYSDGPAECATTLLGRSGGMRNHLLGRPNGKRE